MPVKFEISRRLQFCAGHRVMGHENKCAGLHGHNYEATVFATADQLDSLGRVIDFGVLKEKLGSWLDENWDHAMILYQKDLEAIQAIQGLSSQRLFRLPSNPTAENMAIYLLEVVCPRLFEGTGVRITRLLLQETPNCCAEATLS
ncbi:MAG: 6-carboxytetrahydropterin synthase [Vulcanimicrobiota bacterium]